MGVVAFGLVMLGAVVACMSFRQTYRNVGVVLLVLFASAGALAKSWDTLTERFSYTTFDQEYVDLDDGYGRGVYLALAGHILKDHFWGVGLNNWSYVVTNKYGARFNLPYKPYQGTDKAPDLIPMGGHDGAQAAPAHNLGALTIGELGLPGFLIFSALWFRWFQVGAHFLRRRTPDIASRLGVGIFFALCGCFLQSLTEPGFRQTHIFLMTHILVGALAAVYALRRSAHDSAGILEEDFA